MFEYIKSPQNPLLLKLQFRFGFLFSDVLCQQTGSSTLQVGVSA